MGLHLSTWLIYFPGTSQRDHFTPVMHCCSLPHKVASAVLGTEHFSMQPVEWISISLRSANNLNRFKKALKTFLFKDAYKVYYILPILWTLSYLEHWFSLICITDPMDLFFSNAFNIFLNSYWCVCVPLKIELLDLWEKWCDRNAAK